VTRVVVEVMPKPEILDPQGQAIVRALPSLGFDGIASVRQGKRFELDVADDADAVEVAQRAAEALLANPVIENFTVRLEQSNPGPGELR
jgi:phosphoribosylformylglycinamidine synthase